MVNCDNYNYRVTWSVEDEEFVGLCVEYPSLSYLDEDRYAALEGITNLVKDVVADLEANGEKVPHPLPQKATVKNFR
ncbi:toxin-antitoxin system HicB family antitoxin [Crocosphaera sp.]|uniref:toxin-antitoxin system HicB family antitoxin n=1 Tax=Crocosphaera sp. TaxID=2729996 RepID=UPI0026258767|nr:toxin-antitoxin system HicB family antitoxin [Crocosphaera sp.]MDJ0580686.1 toxin-antitoxin system HicB family antitoxin [Crocosphaera sp.]